MKISHAHFSYYWKTEFYPKWFLFSEWVTYYNLWSIGVINHICKFLIKTVSMRLSKDSTTDPSVHYPACMHVQGVKQSVCTSVIVVVVIGTKITRSRVLGICAQFIALVSLFEQFEGCTNQFFTDIYRLVVLTARTDA